MNTSSNNTSDLEKKSEDFLNAVVLNIVRKELPDDSKKQFYRLLENDKYEEARKFAFKNIPGF